MTLSAPKSQTALLLHAAKQSYKATQDYPIPTLKGGEVLVRTQVIGLNPLDWKAPDFNFALPVLPYIAGRELVGEIVETSEESSKRYGVGDQVIVVSTDYRDLRKASFQEYVVASDFNILRLPSTISPREGASVGVGFVAAALALGICLGLDFSAVGDGPDLLSTARAIDSHRFPPDVKDECLSGIDIPERAGKGDWLVIWGGSSVTASLASQLARLACLRVLLVVNQAKHGLRITQDAALRPDLLVDGHDPARAVEVIRGTLGPAVRFAIDTNGRDSTAALIEALAPAAIGTPADGEGGDKFVATTSAPDGAENKSPASRPATPPGTPSVRPTPPLKAHVVGLAGIPKTKPPAGVCTHAVPIKLFHEMPEIGGTLAQWLGKLLNDKLISCPNILAVDYGLDGVNTGLDRLRSGVISGGRAVVELSS